MVQYKGASSVAFSLALSDAARALFTADSSGKGQAASGNLPVIVQVGSALSRQEVTIAVSR